MEIIRYIFMTTVVRVEEREQLISARKSGEKDENGKDVCVFVKENLGWFVTFADSHESISFGKDKPLLKVGDKVKITMEKPNA